MTRTYRSGQYNGFWVRGVAYSKKDELLFIQTDGSNEREYFSYGETPEISGDRLVIFNLFKEGVDKFYQVSCCRSDTDHGLF